MKKKPLKLLSDEQLNKLPTKRLLNVLNSARAVSSGIPMNIMWSRSLICCEVCNVFIGTTEEYNEIIADSSIKRYNIYITTIKSILATRENIKK